MKIKTVYFNIIFLLYFVRRGDLQLQCNSCQGGYTTGCGKATLIGGDEDCEGSNAQCYEAIKYFQRLSQIECSSCQGGYTTNCAQATSLGDSETCEGNNAQCYEAIKYFQRGAIKYVERRCWVPDKSSKTTNYCSSFNNPNGQLIYCRTCRTSNCNTHPYGTCGLKDPNPPSNFTDFHYVGSSPAE